MRGARRVADVLVEVCEQAGARVVFAMPAESLNPILDAIRKRSGLRLVTVRHEGHGALMASAYAKLTGALGVCMGTAGPGATHLPVGAYDAEGDRAPLLLLSGQVPIASVGAQGFQEIDSVALMDDVTHFNRLVASPRQADLPAIACLRALTARGPVHLAFPSDVLAAPAGRRPRHPLDPSALEQRPLPRPELVATAARLLASGGAVPLLIGAVPRLPPDLVVALADRLGGPVLAAPQGVASLAGAARRLARPIAGEDGRAAAREAMADAGAVLVLGPVAGVMATLVRSARRGVQIVPASEPERPAPAALLRLAGDPEILLRQLAGALGERKAAAPRLDGQATPPVQRPPFWAALDHALDPAAVVAIEPGPVLESAVLHLATRDRSFTSSYHFGARGYALPAAIAGTLAFPRRRVAAIATAGGLAEALADLLTARKYELPVLVLCEEGGEDGAAALDLGAFGGASGCAVARAGAPEELDAALREPQAGGTRLVLLPAGALSGPQQPPPRLVGRISTGETLGALLTRTWARAGITKVYARLRPTMEPLVRHLVAHPEIELVSLLDPESAAMAASAYAKWTGRPGVCLAADGPDLVLQLNGLYDAAFDHAPLLCLSGCAEDAGQAGLVRPERLLRDVAERSGRLRPAEEPARTLEGDLRLALGRGGVVHLAIDWSDLDRAWHGRPAGDLPLVAEAPRAVPPEALLHAAADRLASARRATLLIGRGGLGAVAIATELASVVQAPIAVTLPARDAVSDGDPHMVGGAGASGHLSAVDAVRRADVLLVVGSSPRGSVFGLRGASSVIRIDRAACPPDGRRGADLVLRGDAAATLEALVPLVRDRVRDRVPAAGRPQAARRRFLLRHRRSFERLRRAGRDRPPRAAGPIHPAAISRALDRALARVGERAVVVVDVGLTTLWIYRHLFGDHERIWTSSFATMGFALPAAIAIQGLEPDRPVVAVTGDGGLGITLAELATLGRTRAPVVVVVFDNGKLAAIKYEQEVMGWPEYAAELVNGRLDAAAKACGLAGWRIETEAALDEALADALRRREPALLDVICDPHAMPAPPRIHPLQAAGYLVARARELLTALSRRPEDSDQEPPPADRRRRSPTPSRPHAPWSSSQAAGSPRGRR